MLTIGELKAALDEMLEAGVVETDTPLRIATQSGYPLRAVATGLNLVEQVEHDNGREVTMEDVEPVVWLATAQVSPFEHPDESPYDVPAEAWTGS